jgi:hypothetical protein
MQSLGIRARDVFSIFVRIAGLQAIILLRIGKRRANGAQKVGIG